ncbi:spore germination protein GerPC [Lentibacillus daqui]|uniref:spore germination protein GerPC n=1 Tax=Lentibacillus daqui TaxID=2911514 RepID=UPI0022B1785D|nr:spore germination protein GerPC [Lentibacillus daqui]
MNPNEWMNYVYDLHQHIRSQDQKIKDLESRLQQMEQTSQKKNPTTIEKIEYNFDQLKIERLDGTLHIGLSPSDLAKMDEFGVNQTNPPDEKVPLNQTLQTDLRNHIYQEGPKIIQHLAEQYQHPVNENFQHVMLQDIEKQLPQRIHVHEQEVRNNHNLATEDQIMNYVKDQIKHEIHQSLITYMQGNGKEGKDQ